MTSPEQRACYLCARNNRCGGTAPCSLYEDAWHDNEDWTLAVNVIDTLVDDLLESCGEVGPIARKLEDLFGRDKLRIVGLDWLTDLL